MAFRSFLACTSVSKENFSTFTGMPSSHSMNRKIPINRKRVPQMLVISILVSFGLGHLIFFPENKSIIGSFNRISLAIVFPVLLFYVVITFADFMKKKFDKNAGFGIKRSFWPVFRLRSTKKHRCNEQVYSKTPSLKSDMAKSAIS